MMQAITFLCIAAASIALLGGSSCATLFLFSKDHSNDVSSRIAGATIIFVVACVVAAGCLFVGIKMGSM